MSQISNSLIANSLRYFYQHGIVFVTQDSYYMEETIHNHSEMKNERLVILTHAAMWRGTTCFPWQVSY